MTNNLTYALSLDDGKNEMDDQNPFAQMSDKEFDIIVAKFATFLCLIYNKNINPTELFLKVMGNLTHQKILSELTAQPSVILILKLLLKRHPNLIKSKMLKTKAIKANKSFKRKKIRVR